MIHIKIKEPIGNSFSIWDKHLKSAIKKHSKIMVHLPTGQHIIDPQEWMRTGEIQKRPYYRADDPMVLVLGSIKSDVVKLSKPIPKVLNDKPITRNMFA